MLSATEGRVEYAWAAGDTNVEGAFIGEWVVTYPDGRTIKVPTLNFVEVNVQKSL